MKRAVVVGSGGQDGRLLFERLRRDGYALLGIERSLARATDGTEIPRIDITDREEVRSAVSDFLPDEVYFLAAHHRSAEGPPDDEDAALFETSQRVHVAACLNFLEALRSARPSAAFFYAASSRVFGDPGTRMQDESTPLAPTCMYGITKVCGMLCCRLYRRRHGLRASVGVLYNHESPSRRSGFVSRKIIEGALAIRRGELHRLVLADLSARVDWGYAPDFVDAMIRIAALREGEDFVVATGVARSVREFAEATFALAGLDVAEHLVEDPALAARRSPSLVGNAGRLRERTGWAPRVSFEEMVRILWRAACEDDDRRRNP